MKLKYDEPLSNVAFGLYLRRHGKDSVPAPIFHEDHWPELVIIAVVPRGAEEPASGFHEAVMRRG